MTGAADLDPDRGEHVRTDPTSEPTVRLTAGSVDTDGVAASVEIAAGAGGRIRQVVIERDGDRAELLAPSPRGEHATSTGWGSFVMAPWAGRIRHGRFEFLDHDVRLDLNRRDGPDGGGFDPPLPAPTGEIAERDRRAHSIHGTTFFRPWQIERRAADHCELRCDLGGALGWPFGGVAAQTIVLTPSSLTCGLTVTTGIEPFPAAIGWHPWFVEPREMEMSPVAMYELDDLALPTGRLIEPSPGPWDDCFVNHRPVVLHYDRRAAPTVTVTSDCDHLVVYDQPHHATCIEPQSGPPDAPNVRPEVVVPGRALQRTMTWTW